MCKANDNNTGRENEGNTSLRKVRKWRNEKDENTHYYTYFDYLHTNVLAQHNHGSGSQRRDQCVKRGKVRGQKVGSWEIQVQVPAACRLLLRCELWFDSIAIFSTMELEFQYTIYLFMFQKIILLNSKKNSNGHISTTVENLKLIFSPLFFNVPDISSLKIIS